MLKEIFVAWLDGDVSRETASPLLRVFSAAFFIWNWRIFYILFWDDFVEGSKTEYILNDFLWNEGFWQKLGSFSWVFIIPIIITYFIIKFLPYLQNWAHTHSTKQHFFRQTVYNEAKLEHEKREKDNLAELVVIKKEQKAEQQELDALVTKEEGWENQFNSFKLSGLYDSFDQVIHSLYSRQGFVSWSAEYDWEPDHISEELLAHIHTNGLVEISDDGRSIKLTDKGRFFVRKFTFLNAFKTKNMQTYKNLNGDSGVDAYEYGEDFIDVRFKKASVSGVTTYKYTYSSAGRSNIEEMKRLADIGSGLNSYIIKNVKKKYTDKW